jgi:hypothetical protein
MWRACDAKIAKDGIFLTAIFAGDAAPSTAFRRFESQDLGITRIEAAIWLIRLTRPTESAVHQTSGQEWRSTGLGFRGGWIGGAAAESTEPAEAQADLILSVGQFCWSDHYGTSGIWWQRWSEDDRIVLMRLIV